MFNERNYLLKEQRKNRRSLPDLKDLDLATIKENIQSNYELYLSLAHRKILIKIGDNGLQDLDLLHTQNTFKTFRDNADKIDMLLGKKKVTLAKFKKEAISAIETRYATYFQNTKSTHHLDCIEMIKASGKELLTDTKLLRQIHNNLGCYDLIPEYTSIILNNNLFQDSSNHVNDSFFKKIAYTKEEIEEKLAHKDDLNKYVINLEKQLADSGFDVVEVLVKLRYQLTKKTYRAEDSEFGRRGADEYNPTRNLGDFMGI